jgi:adenylate cyclase
MEKTGKKYHKNLAALIIILVLSWVVILCHVTGIMDYVEFKLYDLRINLLASSSRRSDDITLVLLDQTSLDWAQRERGWGWPWPRKAYAEFLDYMSAAKAKSVTFDVIFSEPSIYRNARQDEIIEDAVKNIEMAQAAIAGGEPRSAVPVFRDLVRNLHELNAREDDASFAEAGRNYGALVHGVLFSTQTGSMKTWPANLNKPVLKPGNFDSIISRFDLANDFPGEERETGGQFPIPELRNSAAVIGSLTGKTDWDGVIRRHRFFTVFDDKAVPGLAAASVLAGGYDENITYDPARKTIRWGGYTIPVDEEGKTLLRFRGDPIKKYHNYTMASVLQSAEDYAAGREPLLPFDVFTDSYVFFGFYAQGLFDTFPTPIASVYPGMGVHVTMLDNMLMGDFIQKAPIWVAILFIVASIVLIVVLALFSGRISLSISGLIFVFAAFIAAGFLAFKAGWWIPMAAPILAIFLSYLSATLYSFATEGKDKRFIKGAFSRILSPKVIEQIIADPSQLKLGGERRKMTAIFTDIQRFSSISSELQEQYGAEGPKVLVNLLNLYLTEMSNIVLENGGTIDKYEGDAIIAFFGAPSWNESHAIQACQSVIKMKKREQELKAIIMNPDGEFYNPLVKLIETKVIPSDRPLFTRLGVNTRDMVVGFMGTPSKMDYTIMGNAVNLAARLEGVNKQYNTHGILISEYTRDEIGDGFITRPLSRVTVVGIPVPLRLYELLELKDEAPPEMTKMVMEWETAFKAYEGKNFSAAKKIFAEVYQKDPDDKVAKLYLERCEKFEAAPPPAGWDGVDNLTEK